MSRYPSQPPRRRPWLLLTAITALFAVGIVIGIGHHHRATTTQPGITPTASVVQPTANAANPFDTITPMDATGVAGFPLTHMTITRDGVNLSVTVDDGAASPKTTLHATVPLNGTPVTNTPCAPIPGQIPVCVMRWQVHQDKISAWIEAQPGQCELLGSTTPGIRTQIKCVTTHQ